MSSLRQSPLPTLQALSSSLTELTTVLQPLLGHNYEQLNAALQANSATKDNSEGELHGRLDAARMQVSVAYVLLDLVWILLKTKGVDTTNHPVMQELERVKSYFGKIKRVQENEKEPEAEKQNHSKVDKSAAGRFIRAALAGEPGSTPGKHTKFEDDSTPKKKAEEKKEVATPSKKKGAETAGPSTSAKKKRPAMDSFEGYDKPKTPQPTPAAKESDSAASSPAKKKKKSAK